MRLFTLSLILFFAASLHAQTSADSSFTLGKVHTISSTILNEKRVLNVYLPEGYTENDSIQYPVVYVLDGSANEDFIHTCGLAQFLAMYQLMPASIVVGIANVDRKRDYTFPTTIEQDKKDFPTTGGSAKFIEYVEKEVKPFIAQHYHIQQSATIIGQSLGGLLATEILFKKPALFTQYIIVSPSLWWNGESLLKDYQKSTDYVIPANTSVFVAVGKEGKVMENDAKKLSQVLEEKKGKGVRVFFEYFPDENHATILHIAEYMALKKLNTAP